MRKELLLLSLAACGLKVNINGKTHTLGGSQETAQAPAPAAAPTHTSPGAAAQPDAPQPAANYTPAQIAVHEALTATPLIADVQGVALDGSFRKTIGGDSGDCGSQVSPKPVAVVNIDKPSPNMHIAVHGARDDGFVLKRGNLFWTMCTDSIGQVPTMGPPKEGWQPGAYEVYPVTRYASKDEGFHIEVAVYDPDNVAPWSSKVRAIKLDHKLTAPMLVEVPVRADRQQRREGLSGDGCSKAAFAFEPDISFTIARPIPGLVIRPLPSKTPVTLRLEHKDDKRARKFCPSRRESGGSRWMPESEVSFGSEDEGLYGISVGLPAGASEDKITLMIFDQSTQFDALALAPLTGPLDLSHRALPWHFPQLNLEDINLDKRVHAELIAKLFAAAPAGIFVYPDLDLDGDLARPANGMGEPGNFPKKNEPLLVESAGDHVRVVAADGLEFDIKATHLKLEPEGAAAPLAAPRPLNKKLELGTLEQLAPDNKLAKEIDSYEKRHDACVDRVAAPYDRQITTVYVGNEAITVDDAHTRNVRDAEDRAIIASCGSRESFEKQIEAYRQKMLAQVEKSRVALLQTAKPHTP
ncbi:MAG: hypothetical protein JO257_16460 [Deltaproteobacteria bacterium]|nr:hypothetical protein [Deltaproteobacteria bacterium]